jgi:hypothetical protein
MFYIYGETAGVRALLTTAPDVISAQFFAAKYSLTRAETIAIYPTATGLAREPLMLFENGRTVVKATSPLAAVAPVALTPLPQT